MVHMSVLFRSTVGEDATARPRGVFGGTKWPKCWKVLLIFYVFDGRIWKNYPTPPSPLPPVMSFLGPLPEG